VTGAMAPPRRVLYCHCARTALVPRTAKEGVLRRIAASDLAVEAVPDLCVLAARKDPLLSRLAGGGPLTIVACAPRAVRWLFAAAGAALDGEGVEILDLRQAGAEAVIRALPVGGGSADGDAERLMARLEAAAGEDGGPSWFPVVDFDLCNHCRQCLGFCLCGVYAAPGGRVEVAKPGQCKIDCPACARVCPLGAILFPKFPHAPVNGAASSATAADAVAKVDISDLLGGDVYDRLRARNAGAAGRFSTGRGEPPVPGA
jgi:NAD-dependent dihydropyrimidine dehydrogenase PreA subunit